MKPMTLRAMRRFIVPGAPLLLVLAALAFAAVMPPWLKAGAAPRGSGPASPRAAAPGLGGKGGVPRRPRRGPGALVRRQYGKRHRLQAGPPERRAGGLGQGGLPPLSGGAVPRRRDPGRRRMG